MSGRTDKLFRPTLSIEQTREIFDIDRPEKYKCDDNYYKKLADKYNISGNLIRLLLSPTDNRTKELYRRYSLKKVVTEEHAKKIIADMYKDYFHKEPDEIKAVDRYGTIQIVIKPEMLILQLDEQLLTDLNRFVNAASRSVLEAYLNYKKRNRKDTTQ